MKITHRLLILALATSILSGCASESPATKRTDQDYAAHMAIPSDNLIVPGDRVGPVFLGMLDTDLYKRMGEPNRSFTYQEGETAGTTVYTYGGLSVYVFPDHRVRYVYIGSGYRTQEGAALGTSQLALRAELGEPAWTVLFHPDIGQWKNCYDKGLVITLTNGAVDGLVVVPPGC